MLNPSAVGKIHYIVVHPTPQGNDFSAFQGYGPGLLSTAYAFSRIATLPLDVLDFGRDWDEVLVSRLKGDGCGVSPLQADAFQAFLMIEFPFVCVCSHPEVSDAVEKMSAAAGRPIHHVRLPSVANTGVTATRSGSSLRIIEAGEFVTQTEGAEALTELSYEGIFAYVQRVLEFLDRAGGPMREMAAKVRKEMGEPASSPPPRLQINVPTRHHFVTAPTESALLATGFALGGSAAPPSGEDEQYVQAIAAAARPLIERRQAILTQSSMLHFLRPIDVILAAPALLAQWYESKRRRFRPPEKTAAGKRTRDFVRMVTDAMAAQTGYGLGDMSEATAKALFENGAGAILMMYRREEVRAFTAQLEVRASADAVPVLRLPAGVNRARVVAARLAAAARQTAGANRARKMNRFARELSTDLSGAIAPDLMKLVGQAGDRVKLVSDAPLEWMTIGATPLMLRADCSRIPATPGNTSFALTIGGLEKIIPLSAFAEVLIVRSYSPRDPIRNTLVRMVSEFLKRAGASLGLRVIDVGNLDEFAAALEGFSGALFVFDGHGGVGSSTSPGTLEIGGRSVDLWPLRGQVRIPPIAVLSACDTHAFEGSHGTPAHALLAAGADTVVGTTLPVDANYSALFVARLLYRVVEFLPLLLSGPIGIARWSQVLPGLQRMVYTSEMLRAIDRKNGIRLSEEDYLRAGFIGNTHINGGDAASWAYAARQEARGLPDGTDALFAAAARDEEARIAQLAELGSGAESHELTDYPRWLSAVLDRVAKDTATPRPAVEQSVQEWAWITDAMKYVQLGNPERLLVVRDQG